jgi:hypothetical protein
MIRHLVLWKFAAEAGGRSREENLGEGAARLRALPGAIPEIRELEVHRGLPLVDRSFDLVLLSTFDSLEDLRAYQVHPAHQEVAAFLRSVQTERAVVDFELP